MSAKLAILSVWFDRRGELCAIAAAAILAPERERVFEGAVLRTIDLGNLGGGDDLAERHRADWSRIGDNRWFREENRLVEAFWTWGDSIQVQRLFVERIGEGNIQRSISRSQLRFNSEMTSWDGEFRDLEDEFDQTGISKIHPDRRTLLLLAEKALEKCGSVREASISVCGKRALVLAKALALAHDSQRALSSLDQIS